MLTTLDDFLRGRGIFTRAQTENASVPWRQLVALALVCGPLHGFAMGMFAAHPEQGIYSAIKVPVLLLVASLLCIPSFYVFHALLGIRDDFAKACRAVLAAQTALAVCLASLTPILLVIYASTADYPTAVFANGVLFAVATASAQTVLQRDYAVLIVRNPAHRITRRLWTITYVFVAVQLAWVLRPFIGSPNVPPQFFRDEAWSNAYVVVFELLFRVFG